MSRAFKKENLLNKIHFGGNVVQFDQVTNNSGVTLLDEAQHGPLIAELDRLADSRTMGVVRISLEARDELVKKKPTAFRSQQQYAFGPPVKVFRQEKGLSEELPAPSETPSVAEPAGNPFAGVPVGETPTEGGPSPELLALQKELGQSSPQPSSEPRLGPRTKVKTAKKSELKAMEKPAALTPAPAE